jgi:hypothetical protein
MFKRTKGFVGIVLVIVLTSCTSSIVESDMQIVLQTLTPANAIMRQPYKIEEVTEEVRLANPKTVYRQGPTVSGGVSWLAAKVDNGSPKLEQRRYMLAYDQFGNLLSKEFIPESEKLIPSSPIVYQYGAKPQRGAVFFPSRITRYGADCGGCKPNENGESYTASGVMVSSNTAVRQMDGTWQDGILYEGYYVLASSSSLPLCTIVEITNHKFSGMGLKPGVPFKAIILDRGVSGRKLDLFVGTETNLRVVRELSKMYPRATIIGFAEYTKNSMGQRICKVN